MRNPTWFSPEDAKRTLAKGREVKYAREFEAVIDRAMVEIGVLRIPLNNQTAKPAPNAR
jgi:hypothetical protein